MAYFNPGFRVKWTRVLESCVILHDPVDSCLGISSCVHLGLTVAESSVCCVKAWFKDFWLISVDLSVCIKARMKGW
jgi:hypothetical protein